MKPFPAMLSLGMASALLCSQVQAASAPSTVARATELPKISDEVSARTPSGLAHVGSPAERHVFPVVDEKGLLLTCIAPEMETNKDTDNFKNCALAPGRSLDDVMHSFIRAAHQQQLEVEAERVAREHTNDKAQTNRGSK